MRLAEMVSREDFYNILSASVTKYFQEAHGKDVCFSYTKRDACQRLIINGKLGFISPFPPPSGLRKFLLAEYNVRGSKIKYLIGKAAALLLSAFPQIGNLKNAYITEGVLGKHTFISPQNRSIRFFDYEAMVVDCVIKEGFTDKYFANQLAFRKQYQYDFILPLLESAKCWFREPILLGNPLARVTDERKYAKAEQDALRHIRTLAEDTLTYESAQEYVGSILKHIEALVAQAVSRKQIQYASQTLTLARNAAGMVMETSMQIPLCMSHGDFQGGNIWLDKQGKTWLYDWETAGRRSVWYDSAVLCYSLRRAYGWASLMQDAQPQRICNCDPQKVRDTEEYACIKRIVLLEDIAFYLEDMLELPEDWGAQIFDSNMERLWMLFKEN